MNIKKTKNNVYYYKSFIYDKMIAETKDYYTQQKIICNLVLLVFFFKLMVIMFIIFIYIL